MCGIPVGVDLFAKAPVRTKTEALKTWLPKFVRAVMEGRYPQTDAPIAASIVSSTVSEFLKEHRHRHCDAERLNMDSLAWKLKVIDRRFGGLRSRRSKGPDQSRTSKPI